jgi:hypothetical protein
VSTIFSMFVAGKCYITSSVTADGFPMSRVKGRVRVAKVVKSTGLLIDSGTTEDGELIW